MQRLKKVVKKIAAIGTGAAFMGASITSAFAADLADYPAPFVDDGKFNPNTAIVVGAQAAAADTLGGIDIAQSLQFQSKVCTPSSGQSGSVQVAGDAVEISRAGDLLEMRESIGDVRETLTEVELDGLSGGTVTTNEGTTDFNQYLRFSDKSTGTESIVSPLINYTENDAPVDEVGDWLFFAEGAGNASLVFFEYELEFEDGLESEISSGKLIDLEDEEVVVLGTPFTFVDTSVSTTLDDVTLELLGGAVYDILEEGETKTYSIDGKDYEVNVLIIEDTNPATATLVINGEITDQLLDGETEILSDGLLLGVSDIILNEAGEAGSGDIVELYLGATKLELTDTDYTDSETSNSALGFVNDVEIDEETIEDAFVQIKANELSSGAKFEIFSIKYRLNADPLSGYKDVWVAPGHGVREYLDEPQGMLGSAWDIRYEGLDDTGVSILKLDPQGDDEYRLIFENSQGLVYNIPFVTNEGGTFKFGEDDKDLVFEEAGFTTTAGTVNASAQNFSIGILDYFVLSDQDAAYDNTAVTHVVRYDSIDTSDKQLQFDELATGNRKFVYEDTTNIGASIGRAELVFGGNTYVAYVANLTDNSAGTNPLAVDQDGDGDLDRSEIKITLHGGGIVDMGQGTNSTGGTFTVAANNSGTWSNTGFTLSEGQVNVTLTTLSEDFDENRPTTVGGTTATDEWVNLTVESRANNRIGLLTSVGSNGGVKLHQPDEDDDNFFGMSDYGVFINLFDPEGTDDAETLTVEYPLQQRGARVFVVFGDTTTTKTTAGESCSVAKIDINNLLDSEVSDAADYNVILVGGPCANTLTADLFVACDAWSYGPGEAVVELADNGDNVAMLVAGTDAIDTRRAAKAIANFADYEFSGSKAMVSGTLSSPSVNVE